MSMTPRSLAASVSTPEIHCQNPCRVAGSLKWITLIRSTARPIWRVMRMSIVIQMIRSEQAMTANDLTGRRKENIQRMSWKLVFSESGRAGSATSARAAPTAPFAPPGGDDDEGGRGADEEGGGDWVLDTAVVVAETPNPYP